MHFFELLAQRRSIRRFRPRAVEPDKLQAILDAAAAAPSAGNRQAYEIVVLANLDEEARHEVVEAGYRQDLLTSAPTLLVFCADPERSREPYGERGASLFALQDATVAAAYAQLAATALALSSCWVGAFDEDRIRILLRLPARLRPVAILAIGYAAEQPERPARRSANELVRQYA
jgi:nitroreductase